MEKTRSDKNSTMIKPDTNHNQSVFITIFHLCDLQTNECTEPTVSLPIVHPPRANYRSFLTPCTVSHCKQYSGIDGAPGDVELPWKWDKIELIIYTHSAKCPHATHRIQFKAVISAFISADLPASWIPLDVPSMKSVSQSVNPLRYPRPWSRLHNLNMIFILSHGYIPN